MYKVRLLNKSTLLLISYFFIKERNDIFTFKNTFEKIFPFQQIIMIFMNIYYSSFIYLLAPHSPAPQKRTVYPCVSLCIFPSGKRGR